MSKYFILAVESLIRTFTVLDSGKNITFGLSAQDEEKPLENLEKKDIILGYVRQPVNEIRYVFEVIGNSDDNQIELIKKIEVEKGTILPETIAAEELNSESDIFEISEDDYKNILNGILNNNLINTHNSYHSLENIEVTAEKLPVPYNYLVFGAPGTGKSHLVKKLQKKYFSEKERFERVTFYSNYSYANFVGTYKPKMEGSEIVYSFIPGPFTRVIEKALKNPDKNYLLIVEEINRANPASVFGDVFQLLDREKGKSEYTIETSEDLRLYLTKSFITNFDELEDEKRREETLLQFSELYIPENMYIWSTMNSADQGVFPMDTAFKRRWEFKYIGIDENCDSMQHVNFITTVKDGNSQMESIVNWNKLRCEINAKLSEPKYRISEDKLIGPYFISNDAMMTNSENHMVVDNDKFLDIFKSKVIMYLFEDAAKQRKSEMFSGCKDFTKFSSICHEFDNIGIEIFGKEILENVLEN